METQQEIQQALRKLVADGSGDTSMLDAQLLMQSYCSAHPEDVRGLMLYTLAGWRAEYRKARKLEAALTETAEELKQIRDGGRVGAVYVGDFIARGGPGEDPGRSIEVGCRGALLEVPLSRDLAAVELVPGDSMVFLDQQCRCAVAVGNHAKTSGRIGTIVRLYDDTRACVRFAEGRGEAMVSISRALNREALKPEESVVRVIEATPDFLIAVEVLPEAEANEVFADGLETMPRYSRENVVGQDEAWEELDKLLLRGMRNPLGCDLYNINGHEGALARNHGVFIAGPTGVGKSMLVAAALHEMENVSGKKLLVKRLTGSSFSSMWFGESEQRARAIYRRMSNLARQNNRLPVIVIDEAGPAFVRRTGASAESGGAQAHSDLTNTFLYILDRTDVITIAIDNNPTAIDPAILRPGRLPLVRTRRPGYRQCVEMVRRNLARTLLAPDETPGSLATQLCDFIFLAEEFQDLLKVKFVGGTQHTYSGRDLVSGADIVEGIVTPAAESALKRDEAAGATAREDFSGITAADLQQACLKRFDTIVGNIDRNDAGEYLDIPEGKIVQSVEKKQLITQ